MFKSFKIRTCHPINLKEYNKQNLKHVKQEIMMKKITKLKEEKNQKHNKVNDITYQKFVDVLRSLQKNNIMSTENGKSKCLFYIYIKKNMKNKIK
jgi:hypothetical protein